ncbi:MAG TPA: TerB family tellurite resistance protein, partial [Candidatus Accumulibacter phosphatis]|nr:hypothetical protein [Accumulibacter sp.]HCV13967.1 hypothetical protein [Accumulibacter sp.]HRQ95229.1 TerB family tellurite resistance protein [Candidatus Accumulibacter phosphatis]
MRHYTTDSAEAMSRVVALALLADGALDNREIESLSQHGICDRLHISPATLDRVIHEFCDDLMQCARAPNVGQIELDRELIDHLLDDIRSPDLQQQALGAIVDIANADGCLNGGEAIVISEAMSLWGLELQRVTRTQVRPAQKPYHHLPIDQA